MVGIEEGDAVLEPLFAVLGAKVLRTILLCDFQHDFQLRVHDFLMAFQRQVQERTPLFKTDDLLDNGDGLGFVKQADDRGLDRLDNVPAGLIADMDIREQERVVDANFRLLDNLESALGHDAQSALGADEDGNQVGTGGVLGHGQGVDDVAVGQHYFQVQAHIVHFAILCGQDADAVVGQCAAHGAAGHAGGQVHHGIALLVAVIFQCGEDHAGLAGDGACLSVQLDELVHPLDVQQDAAGHRQSTALAAGAAAPGGDGDLIVVGNLHDLGDFLGRAGTDDNVRHGAFLTGVLPLPAQPEIVNGINSQFRLLGGHIFRAHRVLEFRADHLEHQRAFLHGTFFLSSHPMGWITQFSP